MYVIAKLPLPNVLAGPYSLKITSCKLYTKTCNVIFRVKLIGQTKHVNSFLFFNLNSPGPSVLRVGPKFENSFKLKCSFLASISLLLFGVSIMLNLPIVSLFFKSHPWLHDANKQIRFLKMHYEVD